MNEISQTKPIKRMVVKTANWLQYALVAFFLLLAIILIFFKSSVNRELRAVEDSLNPVLTDISINEYFYDRDNAYLRLNFIKSKKMNCELVKDKLFYYKRTGGWHIIPPPPNIKSRPGGIQISSLWRLPGVSNICSIDIYLDHKCDTGTYTSNGVLEQRTRTTHYWNPDNHLICKEETL